ncbi:MAG: hypothetical protein EBS01_03060 [Verrucomicrobia bacterium]|nr:hypothetical protein [Verrucomicrobiota bacterium]
MKYLPALSFLLVPLFFPHASCAGEGEKKPAEVAGEKKEKEDPTKPPAKEAEVKPKESYGSVHIGGKELRYAAQTGMDAANFQGRRRVACERVLRLLRSSRGGGGQGLQDRRCVSSRDVLL